MTSILAGHGGAAIGKAEVNALPKDTRAGVADRTLGSLRPLLLIFAVNIDHLIKTNSGMWFLFHSTSAQVSTEVAAGPKVKWKQMKWPGVDPPTLFFWLLPFSTQQVPIEIRFLPPHLCVCVWFRMRMLCMIITAVDRNQRSLQGGIHIESAPQQPSLNSLTNYINILDLKDIGSD